MRRFAPYALAGLLALPALAQSTQAPAPAPQARPGRGDFQELGLSEDQRRKIRDIREQYPNDPQARRKAIQEVLTPEQREKLKDLRRHRRELRRAPQEPS
ncbi:MAG TPA: hypothetical protein VL181_08410 [Holophagaceae bacterium]|nr:hypothetical protein [Holophagaceae bacterium]